MIKQLSEREKHKLNELLQVNIISNSHNEKTARQKPKSLKFDIFGDKEINCRNRPNLTTYNSFFNNNKNIKNNSRTSRKLSYKPRRLVKLEGGEIPLKLLGKATLDYTKTFYQMEADDFDKKLSLTRKKNNKEINPIENEMMNINNQAEFKAASGVKFAQSTTNLYKLKRNVDLLSENRRRNYEDLLNKILKLLDMQSQLFFLDDNEDKNNIFSKTTSTFNTLYSQKSNSLNYKSISTESNDNNKIPAKMRKVINLCLEIGITFYKFLTLIFTELREKHNENIKLLKKYNEEEIRVNQISKELDTLQKYHNRYDVSSKIYLQQGRENTIKRIKDNFNRKENEYILNIYKLEDEIRNLTILLSKNKDYYNKLKEKEKEVEKNKRQNEEMKSLYNKEIHEKIIQNANEKDREEELNNKIIDLEETIEKLKEEQEVNKRQEIETNAKVKKIRMIINEKSENILMLNEELEWYIREYQKEKFNHNNTKTALQILENRIFKDDVKTDRDKSKKEDSDDIYENNKKTKDNLNKKEDKEDKEIIKLTLNISGDSN